MRAACCCLKTLTQARVGRAGPLVERRRAKGSYSTLACEAGGGTFAAGSSRPVHFGSGLWARILPSYLSSFFCLTLPGARRFTFRRSHVVRRLPDLRGRSLLVWAYARWFGCTPFLLTMDRSVGCTRHLSQSSASSLSRDRAPRAFRCGPFGMSRDTQLALDWLGWLVASAAVQCKVKRSFAHFSLPSVQCAFTPPLFCLFFLSP